MKLSFAQNHEDVLLERIFCRVEQGFYVDVGANDPCQDSVTKRFYDRGWHGINIEPGTIFERVCQERPRDINLNVAVSDTEGEVVFRECKQTPGLSCVLRAHENPEATAAGEASLRRVPARTLRSILGETRPDRIDFMSIDVEGHEEQVIRGNDWARFRPRVLVIEATKPRTNILIHQAWEPLLLQGGYLFAFFDGINRYYVRQEDGSLLEHFQCPVNVLDDYAPASYELAIQDITQRHDIVYHQTILQDQQLKYYEKLLAGTGGRTLQIGLGVARFLNRVSRRIRRAS